MAKIRTISQRINDEHVEFQVHYVAKNKRFEVRLPDVMKAFAEGGEVKAPVAETESELDRLLEEFIKRYEAHRLVDRKVIVYRIERSSKNIENTMSWYSRRSNRDEQAFIQFEYEILIERTVDDKRSFFKEIESNYKDEPMRLERSRIDPDDYGVIDWSPEAEKFMEDFYSSMETLMKNIDRFLGTPEKMLDAVKRGIQLLASPKGKREEEG